MTTGKLANHISHRKALCDSTNLLNSRQILCADNYSKICNVHAVLQQLK